MLPSTVCIVRGFPFKALKQPNQTSLYTPANYREKRMHTCNLHTQTHVGVWPSCYDPVHYCSGIVNFLCQDDLEHWGHNCFQNPVQRLRDSGQVCRQNKEVWNRKHIGPKEQKETLRLCSPEINQSSHPHCKTCTSFIPALILRKLHTFLISYTLWCPTHTHMYVLCVWHVRIWAPPTSSA